MKKQNTKEWSKGNGESGTCESEFQYHRIIDRNCTIRFDINDIKMLISHSKSNKKWHKADKHAPNNSSLSWYIHKNLRITRKRWKNKILSMINILKNRSWNMWRFYDADEGVFLNNIVSYTLMLVWINFESFPKSLVQTLGKDGPYILRLARIILWSVHEKFCYKVLFP